MEMCGDAVNSKRLRRVGIVRRLRGGSARWINEAGAAEGPSTEVGIRRRAVERTIARDGLVITAKYRR